MLNYVVLQGRLTRDVELRRTQSGTSVASFSLAVEQDYAGQDGNRGVDFINCVAWKGTGEFIDKWFAKGDMILVSGRLSARTYNDKDGNKRTATEVVVGTANFCGKRDGKSQGGATAVQEFAPIEEEDGALPF